MKLSYKIINETAKITSLSFKNYHIKVNRRNGYYFLDMYINGGNLIETVFIGSAREVYNYLYGMMDGARYKDMMMPF